MMQTFQFDLYEEIVWKGAKNQWSSVPGGVLAVYMTGGSDGASYIIANPNKIHEPEILHPKKYLASKFSTQKSTRPSTWILIYSIRQTFKIPKKNTWQIFWPKKTTIDLPVMYTASTPRGSGVHPVS